MYDTILTVIVGAISGFSSGMFGIAGSNFATPLLRILIDLSPILALATPVVSGIPSAISGSYIYRKEKLIDFELVWLILIAAVPFSLIGSYATSYIDGDILVYSKVMLLLLLGAKFLTAATPESIVKHEKRPVPAVLVSGALGGLIAGLLAIGGGPVFITAFAKIFHMPMRRAVATSLFCVGVISVINSISQMKLGHVDLRVALILVISVIPFSYLGARAAVHLKNKMLEKAFGAVMIFFAVYFIWAQNGKAILLKLF